MPQMFPIYYSMIYLLICAMLIITLVNIFWTFKKQISDETFTSLNNLDFKHIW